MPDSPFLTVTRSDWAPLAASSTPLNLTDADLAEIQGLNEQLSVDEVREVYLPLSRLLNLRYLASVELRRSTSQFLGRPLPKVPFILGIAGSVAVGKSTSARLLQRLLAAWPQHQDVQLLTTDGFLYSNDELTKRGILERKGFPESYDQQALLEFVEAVKSGCGDLAVPVYSHLRYDIVPGEFQAVDKPDILILEGLNVLNAGARRTVADFFDFSIYLDASEEQLRDWFMQRFWLLRETAFKDEQSFFRQFAEMSDDAAREFALDVWETINAANLRENILPTRERATLVLEKGREHRVESVRLRL